MSRLLIVGLIVTAVSHFVDPLRAQECAHMPPGAVAWWPAEGSGDERWEDRIGGHDAQDATTGWYHVGFSPGRVGQAFDFADGDAGMYVPADPDLDFEAL